MNLPMLLDPVTNDRLTREVARRIPEHCQEGLLNYLRYGIPPGHFLSAILANDLAQAAARADEVNQRALYDYVFVLYVHCPSICWGSPEAVREWSTRGMALRRPQHDDLNTQPTTDARRI